MEKAEAWHRVAGSESPKRAWKELPAKVQPGGSRKPEHFRGAGALGQPPRITAAVERSQTEPAGQAMPAADGRPKKWNFGAWRTEPAVKRLGVLMRFQNF